MSAPAATVWLEILISSVDVRCGKVAQSLYRTSATSASPPTIAIVRSGSTVSWLMGLQAQQLVETRRALTLRVQLPRTSMGFQGDSRNASF